MTRRVLSGLLALGALGALLSWDVQAQAPSKEGQWIWFNEGDPLSEAPTGSRFFRKTFTIKDAVGNASVEISADNQYTLFVNGEKVGSGNDWSRLDRYDLKKRLVVGKNALAVEGVNEGGPAGLIVRLTYGGKSKHHVNSDASWKASKTAPDAWKNIGFDDSKWVSAKALVEFGKAGPWKAAIAGRGPGSGPTGTRTFKVPEGFKVELAVTRPDDRGPFSLVNMCFDNKGRLLLSQEGGPTLLCTDPDKDGVYAHVRDYCTQVKGNHGMCWAGGALYLVGNGPQGTGLYKCRDTRGEDKIDEVTLLHRYHGGMGEHGPHAVVHGPDNMLYIMCGNHSWTDFGPKKEPNPAKLADNSPLLRWPTGGPGPDQGKPGSTEDVLLPRLNDANGHAANILAPGGSLWRMTLDGKKPSLFTAGFRNAFDMAFSPNGELFSFDSDMEWDENLPWYRAVRVNHCTPGADFVWRTGAANTPGYYLDSLPPLYETGRGSPVGLEFYDHEAFPKKYRGAYFMADWSLGIIYAVHLKRDGATYKATEVEKFCTGSPLNVTDLAVGPDGAIYFTMGGRGTQGGVYRIVANDAPSTPQKPANVQPLAPWSRSAREAFLSDPEKRSFFEEFALGIAIDPKSTPAHRIRGLALLNMHNLKLTDETLVKLAADADADVRAQAVYLLGVRESKAEAATLLKALQDKDAFVRRRACEALIRAGIEPLPEAIWPLLGDSDRFVQTAARLVLQRIDPAKWAERITKETNDRIANQAVVALCKIGKAADHAKVIYERLNRTLPTETPELLDRVRTLQLVAFHIPGDVEEAAIKEIANRADKVFPHTDKFVNRELAILLAHYVRTSVLAPEVSSKLLSALFASEGDKQQQIHLFYCLRLIPKGWSEKDRVALAAWYDATRTWTGGHSYAGFLANIFRECLSGYTEADRTALLASADKQPQAALVLLQRYQADGDVPLASLKVLASVLEKNSFAKAGELRKMHDALFIRSITNHPTEDAFPELIRGASSSDKLLVYEVLSALQKLKTKPKPDQAAPFRAVILASSKLDPANRWKAVEVLRHWTNDREFGADKGEWKPELEAWTRWYGQTFPKEPALPAIGEEKPTPSKYAMSELLPYLTTGAGKSGDVKKGRVVFEKASCIKCHKYGKDGEGVGPDLTTLSKRFKRLDVLESILYPSKVISDQYRSTTFETNKGQVVTGLAAVQGDVITVLQSDGTKVPLNKKDVAKQVASLVSVMPEKLLDTLTKEEIADLFAFLESEPAK
jgi:putative heme-binding domain-containing protein